MAFLLRLCGLLWITGGSAFWGRAEDPVWMAELKSKCVGAEDQYYVDDQERRCCKCTPCESYSHPREIQCDSPNFCQVKYYSDCVYDSDFDSVFKQPIFTIAVTDPLTTTKNRAETEMSNSTATVPSTTVLRPQPTPDTIIDDEPSDNSFLVAVVMSVAAICITALVLLVVVLWCWRKCGDTGNGSLMKLMHMCKGDESFDSEVRDRAKSGDEEEGECLVRTEEPAAINGSPPQPLSQFGPAAMPVHPDLRYGIDSRNEGLSGRSFDTSDSYRDFCEERSSIPRPSGGFISQIHSMPFSIDRNIQQTAPNGLGSVNSGIVTSGNGNFSLVQATNGATVNIHNAEISIVYPSHPPDNLDLGAVGQFNSQNVAITPHAQQEQPSQLPSPQLPLASESSRGDENVRSNPCFPSRTGGEFVTSASTSLSERENCIRRQSSQISSTASGPVENGFEDYESEKSVPKELSRVQESCYPTYQSQSSGSASIRTSSSRGPVQHSSNRESLPYSQSDHLSQENSSLRTGVVHSPQADLEESM